jgi:hypothetical protein
LNGFWTANAIDDFVKAYLIQIIEIAISKKSAIFFKKIIGLIDPPRIQAVKIES